jgi:hypothetical protein
MSREGDWRVRVVGVTEGGGRSRRIVDSDVCGQGMVFEMMF